MGTTERRSVLARREDLSPVCKALYQMAFEDLTKVIYASRQSTSPGLFASMWNRLQLGSSPQTQKTNVDAILSGIMDQIEALDRALKENSAGVANLLAFLEEINIPNSEPSVTPTQTDTSISNKEAFSRKLAHVFAAELHNLAQTTHLDINNPKLAVVLQLLIDVCGKPTSTIGSIPLLNFLTENSDAVKTWNADRLNEIIKDIPTQGVDKLADKLDDSGEAELLTRMLSWRYEANQSRNGVLEMGKQDRSQMSNFVTLIETLSHVDRFELDDDKSGNTVTLNYPENALLADGAKKAAEEQLLSVAQLISGEDSGPDPESSHTFRVISQ